MDVPIPAPLGNLTEMMAVALSALLTIAAPEIAIVPQPVSLKRQTGSFTIEPTTRIVVDTRHAALGRTLRDALGPATGYPFEFGERRGKNEIEFAIDEKGAFGPEGYRLSVTPERVRIEAAQPAGAFYGIQTLRQLLPASIYRKAKVKGARWILPAVEVEDRPRFGWRGAMLDVVRHFMPKETVLKFIDLMALHKLNSLHFHLTDDQGWRIEIKRYPRLTEIGSQRDYSMAGHYSEKRYDSKPHGGYYTQADLREIVAYAADRHIVVVPEIEMPGHSQAAIAAYPELGNTGEPLRVGVDWGVYENVFNVEESTIQFLQLVLAEVLDIFPSKFIHVGGDEVPKTQWKNSPRAQARIKELGLKNEDDLQSWFIKRMDRFLDAKGRRLIGWDEILEGGLAEGATVMSWRGMEGGIKAARARHDVVMAPTSHTYFDFYQSRLRRFEPVAIGGFTPIEKVYAFEPVPKELTAEEAKHVLGAQFQLWAEYIPNPKHLEYMAFPRGAALAEVVWSPAALRDPDSFFARLPIHLERLKVLDVNFRKLDGNGPGPIARWTPQNVSSEFSNREWDATSAMAVPGEYKVLFQFTGGAHRLDVAWVELVVDGVVQSRDEHAGRTGAEDKDNEYKLTLKSRGSGSRVLIRASIRSDGGTDSAGEVFVYPAR